MAALSDLIEGLDSGELTWDEIPSDVKMAYAEWQKNHRGLFRYLDDDEDREYNLLMALTVWKQIYLSDSGILVVRHPEVTCVEAQAAWLVKFAEQDKAAAIAQIAEEEIANDFDRSVE